MGWWFKINSVSEEKLEKIEGGGAAAIWIGIAISAAVIFISGVIEGFTNPKACENWKE